MTIEKGSALATKHLDEGDFVKNEHGCYRYISQDGNHMFNLDGILHDYLDWLIENNHVQEK